ncbi:tyrosine-type recombinase/integrase [Flavimaribacter sediminis]|uniref:tyrosine-type recombinase/integrase n=1 Tax=Flavimaribacter sediminis TaxID=2865987 RepID=UPI00351DF468
MREITAGAIRQSAIRLYPNAGPATCNRQVIVPTQAIINHAAELDWCPPMQVKRFKVATKVKEPATLEWVEAFAEHASPHLGALCLFMFGTGARISEALAMTWSDINLKSATALIRQTKINDERVAHLPPRVVAALANIPSNHNPDGSVFRYVHRTTARQAWNNAIKRAGIKQLSFHSCRHGFATSLLHAGVDVVTVAENGGWKVVTEVVRTYGHSRTEKSVTDAIFDTNLTQPEKSKNASN